MKIKLNLIPSYKRESIRKAHRLSAVFRWEFELALILVVFILMLASMDYILQINLSTASEQAGAYLSENGQYKEIGKYDEYMNDMNAQVKELAKIQGGQLAWLHLFQMLNKNFTDGITLDGVITKNYSVSLSGKAAVRDNLVVFKGNLEQEKCFTDVNLPLSDLVAKDNVEFQIDFNIKKECLSQ